MLQICEDNQKKRLLQLLLHFYSINIFLFNIYAFLYVRKNYSDTLLNNIISFLYIC